MSLLFLFAIKPLRYIFPSIVQSAKTSNDQFMLRMYILHKNLVHIHGVCTGLYAGAYINIYPIKNKINNH